MTNDSLIELTIGLGTRGSDGARRTGLPRRCARTTRASSFLHEPNPTQDGPKPSSKRRYLLNATKGHTRDCINDAKRLPERLTSTGNRTDVLSSTDEDWMRLIKLYIEENPRPDETSLLGAWKLGPLTELHNYRFGSLRATERRASALKTAPPQLMNIN